MTVLGSTLGTIETAASELTRSITILSSYNANWEEERQVTLAEARHERAHRWAKLGASIRTQELNVEDVEMAMRVYKGE